MKMNSPTKAAIDILNRAQAIDRRDLSTLRGLRSPEAEKRRNEIRARMLGRSRRLSELSVQWANEDNGAPLA